MRKYLPFAHNCLTAMTLNTRYTTAHDTSMHTIHHCTRYTNAHDTPLHTIHQCTRYTNAHDTSMHTIHQCTRYTNAHDTQMHTIHQCTRYTNAHDTPMHTIHQCTVQFFGALTWSFLIGLTGLERGSQSLYSAYTTKPHMAQMVSRAVNPGRFTQYALRHKHYYN